MKNRPRTCLGCRERFDRKSLLRVMRIIGDDGVMTIKYYSHTKLQGRGAWVCRKKECVEKVKKTHAFERALKVSKIEDIYEDLLCLV